MGCDAKADKDGKFKILITIDVNNISKDNDRIVEFNNLKPFQEISWEVIDGEER